MPETMTNIPESTVIDPRDLRRLHDLTSRLLEENDLAALLQHVLDASVALLGADKGHLQFHDEHGHALKTAAHTGFDREFLEVLQSSPPERSMRGQRVIVEDASADPELAPLYAARGLAGVQFTPLFESSGKRLGTLSTHFRRAHRPSDGELRLLDTYLRRAERAIERKRLEVELRAEVDRLARDAARLEQSNAALAKSNEELERFVFVATHDLQEPLRTIALHSQLLTENGHETSDRDTAIGNIVSGAARLRELLADLVAYAEFGSCPRRSPETVDLNSVVDTVKQNLQASVDENQAVITHEPLPVLRAPARDLVPLFQNLIANAIKYRKECPPRVHLSVQETDGQLRFAVADNGMGIDPRYHRQIFEIFKRLHGNDIPGTGLGLAICQRVVERYGGRIWVESRLGEGATFRFTLPGVERGQAP